MSQGQDSVSSNLTLGTNLHAVIAQLWQRQYGEDVYSAGSNPAHDTNISVAALQPAVESISPETSEALVAAGSARTSASPFSTISLSLRSKPPSSRFPQRLRKRSLQPARRARRPSLDFA